MRVFVATVGVAVAGVFALFVAQAGVAQGLSAGTAGPREQGVSRVQPTPSTPSEPPNDFARFMSVRQEIAQAGTLAKVNPESARDVLQRAVTNVSQTITAAPPAKDGHNARASLQPADYAALADLASQLDAPGEVRKTLTDCWLDRVSSDETFRFTMTSRHLLTLGRLVKTAQPQRLDTVLAMAAGRIEQLQQSPDPSLLALCDLMETFELGGTPVAEDLHKKLQDLTTKNGRFSKELAPFEIVRLAEYSSASGKPNVTENLRTFVVREYLTEPGIAAAMRLTDWSELLDLLAGSRDAALRREMATLTVRHAGPSLVGARREIVADVLRKVEQAGGTSTDVNALAMRWIGVESASADVAAIRAILTTTDDQAVRAAMMANPGDRDATMAAVESAVKDRDDAVDAAMRTLHERHTAGQFDAAGYALACRLARESGSAQAAAFWSNAALERFLQSKGTDDNTLALLEAAAGADTKMSRETAEKLLARLRDFRDTSWRISDATLQSLAQAFGHAGMADTLYKSLASPDGSGPDFIAVKLLAWIKREQNKIRPFIGELAAPTEKTRGDARARWELARAYAVSLVEPQQPRRTDGNGHIRLALQASRSDATLIMCLEELINACRPTNSYTFPLQVITSTKDRLEDQTKQQLEHMEQQLRKTMTTASAAPPSASSNSTDQPNWQTIYDKKRQQTQRG